MGWVCTSKVGPLKNYASLSIDRFKPSIIDIIATTVVTPISTPKTVKAERSLLALIASKAIITASRYLPSCSAIQLIKLSSLGRAGLRTGVKLGSAIRRSPLRLYYLILPQSLNRIQPTSFPRRIYTEENAYSRRKSYTHYDTPFIYQRRQRR